MLIRRLYEKKKSLFVSLFCDHKLHIISRNLCLTLPSPIRERVITLNDATHTVKLSSNNTFHLKKVLIKVSVSHLYTVRLLF